MPRKILVFFMSMVLLGGYSISVYRAQADSDTDQFPIYWLKGKVWVDYVAGVNEVYLRPTQFSDHELYILVPEVRKTDTPSTDWTELAEYQMGTLNQDEYDIKIY